MMLPPTAIRGVVRDGRIVPEGELKLPEGTPVAIIPANDFEAEMAAWERAGDEAWALIDEP
ncbi:MAG TPA: hypothetical protein VL371_11230, partial [Gemmataceae bacterium]|nr:hypothetical protein [Gemmataceae bacterium]